MIAKFLKTGVCRQYAVVITVNLNVFCMGLGWGWSSPVLVKLGNSTHPVLSRPITESEGSWIAGIYYMAGIIGFLVTFIIDKYGRKKCMLFAAATKVITSFGFVLADEVWLIIFSRAISGVVDNFLISVVPMYTAEIADSEIRGSLGTILQIFGTLGVVVMLCVGPFLDYLTLNITVLCLVAAAAVPLLFIPDSPYFLYHKGKTEESRAVLVYFRSSEAKADDELDTYKMAKQNQNFNIVTVLKSKIFRKAIGLASVIACGSQLTGYNGVQLYLQPILESTCTSVPSDIASLILGLLKLLPCIFTMMFIDRLGRKPILITTLIGQTVGLIGLGTYFYMLQSGYEITGALNAVPLISLALYVCCFSAGAGALIWPLFAELFDGRSRPLGVCLSILFLNITAFLIILFLPSLMYTIGAAMTFWMFACECLFLCVFITFFVPETKGKSFQAIQDELGRKI